MSGEQLGAVREVHVKREMGLLNDAITDLEGQLTGIEERFNEVLRKEGEVAKNPSAKLDEQIVPHADLMRQARQRVEVVNIRLRSVLSRCEL